MSAGKSGNINIYDEKSRKKIMTLAKYDDDDNENDIYTVKLMILDELKKEQSNALLTENNIQLYIHVKPNTCKMNQQITENYHEDNIGNDDDLNYCMKIQSIEKKSHIPNMQTGFVSKSESMLVTNEKGEQKITIISGNVIYEYIGNNLEIDKKKINGNGILLVRDFITKKILAVNKGEFEDGWLNGVGIIYVNEGTTKKGKFTRGILMEGEILYVTKTKEIGKFEDGFLVSGKKMYPDDVVEEGQFTNGYLSGEGIRTYSEYRSDEGNFVRGMLDGKGKRIYKDMTEEGDYVRGRLEGTGKKIFKNSIEEGEFKDDLLNGVGKIHNTSGSKLEGNFVNNILHGIGKSTHIGETYTTISEGTFTNGKLSEGKAIYSDGYEEEGQFDNGYFRKGKVTHSSGTIEEGEFNNYNLTGIGKKTYSEGDIEEGEFNNGKLHGKGKKIYIDGITEEGEYDFGNFKSGKMKYPDGIIEEGEFRRGFLYKGKKTNPDGKIEEGIFEFGILKESDEKQKQKRKKKKGSFIDI